MKKIVFVATAALSLLAPAEATTILPGETVTASTTGAGLLIHQYVLQNQQFLGYVTDPHGFTSTTYAGMYTTGVYIDYGNTLCGTVGKCLTFISQVANIVNAVSPNINSVSTGPLSTALTYDVGIFGNGVAPTSISEAADGSLSFDFTQTPIGKGQSSTYLVIQSSATYAMFSDATVSFTDGEKASVGWFLPVAVTTASAVPEPASWSMMIGGFGLLGTALRRKKASVSFA